MAASVATGVMFLSNREKGVICLDLSFLHHLPKFQPLPKLFWHPF